MPLILARLLDIQRKHEEKMTKIPDSPEHHEAIKELAKQDDAYKDALVNEAKTFGEYQKLLAESRNVTDLSEYTSNRAIC